MASADLPTPPIPSIALITTGRAGPPGDPFRSSHNRTSSHARPVKSADGRGSSRGIVGLDSRARAGDADIGLDGNTAAMKDSRSDERRRSASASRTTVLLRAVLPTARNSDFVGGVYGILRLW